MKRIALLTLLCSTISLSYGQVSSESFIFGGINRTYNLYIPSGYSAGDTLPLVFCLHGLGDTGPNFMGTGFNTVADTANFIAVYPTATFDNTLGGNAWNCGIGFNTNVDDIGFMNALIDTISSSYGVDSMRIHATGFSLGGFMTNRMGCEMSERIASIASVSGLIGNQITCNPSRSLSMMHMHGTADGTITWDGLAQSFPIGQPVDTMINTWKTINNCPDVAVQTALPNIASDNYTIDHFDYSPCDDNTEVELYRINGAGHEWMFTGNDVDSRVEIWRFFYRNRMPELAPVVSIDDPVEGLRIQFVPNPSNGSFGLSDASSLTFPATLNIHDISGRLVTSRVLANDSDLQVDVSDLEDGMYLIQVKNEGASFAGRLMMAK